MPSMAMALADHNFAPFTGTYLNGRLCTPWTGAAVALPARAPSDSLAEILAIVSSRVGYPAIEDDHRRQHAIGCAR
jgi:hypothetical protein